MKKPLVSVVLAVYNAERFLADTIKSVLEQTYEEIQLIIVDDGSTDATAEIARGFTDPRVEFYQLKENRHVSYATNVGLSHVRGEYIAIIDGDDRWDVVKLEKQVNYLEEHPEHKACFTWVDLIDENDVVINDKMPDLYELFACSTDTQEEWLRFFFFKGNRLNNPSSLVETNAAKEVGDHNPFYIQAQDMDWWVRFTKKYAFGVIEEPLTKYRRLNTESSVSSVSEEHDSRFYNELMHIHYKFFDDMEDELFIRTFRPYFVKKDSHTPEELECEKVFLLMGGINGKQVPRAVGVLKAEKMLANPETAELMWSRYGFGTRACGAYTGKHIYNDPILQNRSDSYAYVCNELEAKKGHCELYLKQLDEKEAIIQQNLKDIEIKDKDMLEKMDLIHEKKVIIQKKEIELEQKNREILELKELLDKTNHKLQQAVDTLNEVTSSTAWKMTAPVRKCMDLLRR